MTATPKLVPLSADWQRRNHLPPPDATGNNNTRGTVLVVGGAVELPGSILLAGIAALRAGAGKLQMATCLDEIPRVMHHASSR